MNEREQFRWNTNTEALQPNHEAVSREAEYLSVDISLAISSFSLSLSVSISGCSTRLAMGKLPVNETTVDTKRIIFLPLLHCTGSGL